MVSMQFATVTNDDLREWIEGWQRAGVIRYVNWTKGQKVPRPETIIEVTGAIG